MARCVVCPSCRIYPRRREQNLMTWFECSRCGLRGPARNVNSNYAYIETVAAWNSLVSCKLQGLHFRNE